MPRRFLTLLPTAMAAGLLLAAALPAHAQSLQELYDAGK